MKKPVDAAQEAGGVKTGQVCPIVKSAAFAPDRLTLLSTNPAVPVLVSVTGWGLLAGPTGWSGKGMLVGEGTAAGTCAKIETVLSVELVAARSSRPSPLKSPAATELGAVPVV